jgi:hypothetical protein
VNTCQSQRESRKEHSRKDSSGKKDPSAGRGTPQLSREHAGKEWARQRTRGACGEDARGRELPFGVDHILTLKHSWQPARHHWGK